MKRLRAQRSARTRASSPLARVVVCLALAVAFLAISAPASAQSPLSFTLQVSERNDRSQPVPLDGGTVFGKRYVFVTPSSGVSEVKFYLDDPGATGPPYMIERRAPWDFEGTAADGKALPWLTTNLNNGQHTITAQITGTGGATTVVTATFTVNNQQPECVAIPCTEALVALPYALDFASDHGKIAGSAGVGTGFTYLDRPENGTGDGYVPANLQMNTGAGELALKTTAGQAYLGANAQDNAVGVGVDAPNQVTVVTTTVLDPPVGTGGGEQAGLYFGNDQDNYLKLVILGASGSWQIQYLMEVNGQKSMLKNTALLNLAGATVALKLRASPTDRTIKATYSVNGGTAKTVDTFVAPPEFFSFDAAGIDPRIGTRTFTGIMARHGSSTQKTYRFGEFSVASESAPPPPPSSEGLAFDRTTFPVANPTSIVEGPDGRLYVSELFGTIHALTLDANKQVVADQVINTLGSRLTLGLTIDPDSTPGNVILWAAHSSPSLFEGEPNSSMVTRLSGLNFGTRLDVVTGLPRAKANHAVNSIHFGPDGKLYIAQGGNTGAGSPNTGNTEFGTMKEQPLSAALLVADVKNPFFDGSCNNASDIFGPPPCDVTAYSTGLRNTYDFVFHSNGSIYGPNNGLGVVGTFPPSPTAPCFGNGSTVPWNQGGQNPGEQADGLNRLLQGKYYGHPNPYRNQCVFGDGHFQNVAPLANYTPPIFNLGNNRSANGIIEYRDASKFCGKLQGNLLVANYSVGDDITRLQLSADGASVTSSSSLMGGFTDPLPLAQGADGTVYVGEFGASRVSALTPVDSGCWQPKARLSKALLDVGGTALNGKLYVTGGKTPTTYEKTLYIYDPATDSWTTGADLPGVAVENPALVALGGKIYSFGGQTDPFGGAVTKTAVYDPATNVWTLLAPMPTARGGAAAVALGGSLYVIGGMASNGASVNTVEVYNPATNTWSAAPPLGTRRDNAGAAVLGGQIFVFGGRTRETNGTGPGTLDSVEMLDAASGTWVAKASMPTGRRTMVVGLLRGRAQLMGGERTASGGTFPQNEEYDPATNTWRTLTPMNPGRHGAAGGTINGKVYMVGGGTVAGGSYSDINEVFAFGG
jgi:N-acetylneuraminic acid mutarotase/glucose/arabinose dehydrogenase